MKTLEIVETIHCAQAYAVALYYGDLSGLNGDEISAVTAMIERIGTRTIDIPEQDTDFRRCDISGLKADCVEVNIYDWKG